MPKAVFELALFNGEQILVVRNITQLVQALFYLKGAKFGGYAPMWRGQGSCQWTLETTLHRQARESKYDVHRWEATLTNEFLVQAPSRADFSDPGNSRPRWLVMMRHHGLPTRLLDWSWSPLVAAYFASVNEPKKDALVWALDGASMNSYQGLSSGMTSLLAEDRSVKALVDAPFSLGEDGEGAGKVLAAVGPQSNSRIARQDGLFTIHGSTTPLEQLPFAKDFLAKFLIPSDSKQGILNDLDFLGINRKTLIPDLDSLASDIANSLRATSA